MISTYPVVNKDFKFSLEEKDITEILNFIKSFRNIKQENKISKEAKVLLKGNADYSLIIKMLKLDDHIIKKPLDITNYNVSCGKYEAVIYYEKLVTKDDEEALQIITLTASIKKRENLLANQGFISKAPKELIETEKLKLAEEKKLLNNIQK